MSLTSLVYPAKCMFCGSSIDNDKKICSSCKNKVNEIPNDNVCMHCGAEIARCRCHPYRHLFCFVRNIAVYPYQPPMSYAIHRLKFKKLPQQAYRLAIKMADKINFHYKDISFDYIVFVPMNRIKEMGRGFNQAQLIAEEISKIIDVPVLYGALGRRWRSAQQKKLSIEQRFANAKKSFYLKDISNLYGKTLLLVDDVMTSGSSLSECARKLKEGGAKKVYSVTFTVSCRK